MKINLGLAIEVHSTELREVSGTTRKGKAFRFYRQEAYVHLQGPFPEKVQLTLEEGQAPYAKGRYQCGAELYVDRFGELKLGRLQLAQAKPQAAAG